jgi:chromosomal replication initiator protein
MSTEFPFSHFIKLEENGNKNKQLAHSIHAGKDKSNDQIDNQNNDIKLINDEILMEVSVIIGEFKYNTYFKNNLKISKITDNTFYFETKTKFIIKLINECYLNDIKQIIRNKMGKDFEINISVCNDEINTSEYQSDNELETKPKNIKDVSFNLNLKPTKNDLLNQVQTKVINHFTNNYGNNIDKKKIFQNFIVGPSNNLAFASCMSVAKDPGKVYPTLFIHSDSGLGKTHLLYAVANYLEQEFPHLKLCLTTARQFMTEMVEALTNQKIDQFRKKYLELIDVLIIDDIHELKNKPSTQNEFFHVFNQLYNNGKQLIFTSDKNPKEIIGLEERIKTRLSWGLVIDVQQPDLETRIAILKKKAKEEDIYLSEDVINLIANSIKNNVRELEGSLIKLGAYSSLFKIDIDIEIAKKQLNITEDNNLKSNTIDSITKAVSNYFKIPVVDIRSKSRLKDITHARHISMYLVYKILELTLSEIGTYFGKRDHTSVLHGVEKIKNIIKEDQNISYQILEIENTL